MTRHEAELAQGRRKVKETEGVLLERRKGIEEQETMECEMKRERRT